MNLNLLSSFTLDHMGNFYYIYLHSQCIKGKAGFFWGLPFFVFFVIMKIKYQRNIETKKMGEVAENG